MKRAIQREGIGSTIRNVSVQFVYGLCKAGMGVGKFIKAVYGLTVIVRGMKEMTVTTTFDAAPPCPQTTLI